MDESLIRKFLRNECEPEEAERVAAWLREHPEELERVLPEAEFLAVDEAKVMVEEDIPMTVSEQWLEQVHKEGGIGRGRVRRMWVRRLSVAAILGGLVFGAAMLWREKPAVQGGVASRAEEIPENMQERKENNTNQILAVALPDGSMVRMMPQAVMLYNKKFEPRRDVILEGEAEFEVKPDKERSFTVYSGELSTQVLGTIFKVKAVRGEDTISVRLNTGKVMVRAEVSGRMVLAGTKLAPGQELRYSRRAMTASVRNFNMMVRHDDALVKAGGDGKALVKPDWYQFNNQPMRAVLDQLSSYYGVSIYYYPADVSSLYFDGKFESTDSLEKILTDITLPNNLRFVREDSGYIIRKK